MRKFFTILVLILSIAYAGNVRAKPDLDKTNALSRMCVFYGLWKEKDDIQLRLSKDARSYITRVVTSFAHSIERQDLQLFRDNYCAKESRGEIAKAAEQINREILHLESMDRKGRYVEDTRLRREIAIYQSVLQAGLAAIKDDLQTQKKDIIEIKKILRDKFGKIDKPQKSKTVLSPIELCNPRGCPQYEKSKLAAERLRFYKLWGLKFIPPNDDYEPKAKPEVEDFMPGAFTKPGAIQTVILYFVEGGSHAEGWGKRYLAVFEGDKNVSGPHYLYGEVDLSNRSDLDNDGVHELWVHRFFVQGGLASGGEEIITLKGGVLNRLGQVHAFESGCNGREGPQVIESSASRYWPAPDGFGRIELDAFSFCVPCGEPEDASWTRCQPDENE